MKIKIPKVNLKKVRFPLSTNFSVQVACALLVTIPDTALKADDPSETLGQCEL